MEGLDLSNNHLHQILPGTFDNLPSLIGLNLTNNQLTELPPHIFSDYCSRLTLSFVDYNTRGQYFHLSLSNNNLTILHSGTFQNQVALTYLDIDHNQLQFLPPDIFHNLSYLIRLDLSANNLARISTNAFLYCFRLERLDLSENSVWWVEPDAFLGLNETVDLIVSDPSTCCYTQAKCVYETAPSPFLTCKRLLPYPGLRIAVWFVGALATLGNIVALYVKYANKQQSNKIQFLLITNLSISDFCMGIYLLILLSADMYYAQYFPSFSESWRSSVLCKAAGALSVLSSEGSTFFITLITIDRFLGVKYTFSKYRINTKFACVLVALLWFIAVCISITSFVLSQDHLEIYAISEICVGLPISRRISYVTNETSQIDGFSGWGHPIIVGESQIVPTGSTAAMYFSIAIFTILNLACFLVVVYCYLAIFISARKTAQNAGRSPNVNEEIRLAMRSFLIVFTDFCCWVPIGVLSILVQAGLVDVDPVAYAWIATFILPINSSINPFLYTLASSILCKGNHNH